eukprot:3557228-Pleurochrysis_carterae.AAC.2
MQTEDKRRYINSALDQNGFRSAPLAGNVHKEAYVHAITVSSECQCVVFAHSQLRASTQGERRPMFRDVCPRAGK